jgi:hypothetical protein
LIILTKISERAFFHHHEVKDRFVSDKDAATTEPHNIPVASQGSKTD